MVSYFFRRLLYMILLLFAISVAGFVIITLPPGSYLEYYIMTLQAESIVVPQETIDALKSTYGLDQPLHIQYWMWISNFVRGDFGYSFQFNRPVSELIGLRLMYTVVISICTLLFTWLIAIPIGVYSATHQYSFGDFFFSFWGLVGLSIPNFMLALVLMMVALKVFGLPVGGLFSREYADAPWSFEKALDLLVHLWLPVVVVGAANMAQLIRMMRGNLLDVLNMPFVHAARARGLPERTVIIKHAVRNAIHPLIMLLGTSFPQLISGTLVVAIVLSLPTTGPLYFGALRQQDMYLAITFLMFLSVMLVVGNLLADLLLACIDPRIRYQ